MPFLDITVFEHTREERAALSQRLTEALTSAWGIPADIVTLYYQVLRDGDCAHAGALVPAREARVFIKVHAFPRPVALKREAAQAMCRACAELLRLPAKAIAIYFLEREHQDVSHAGVLALDETN
jgi:phenylpyruvate tautomerase PptA (4-oxalocrotonate tautomerase family)